MTDVVQKLWGFCHTLRHDGIDYGDYIEQITYLLFLKMADERGVELPPALTGRPHAPIGLQPLGARPRIRVAGMGLGPDLAVDRHRLVLVQRVHAGLLEELLGGRLAIAPRLETVAA